jgi:hypothetical protein
MSAGRLGLRFSEVRSCAALIAALRKFPDDTRSGRRVEGSGCKAETRKGGGTSRRVRGWYISWRRRKEKFFDGVNEGDREGDCVERVECAVRKEGEVRSDKLEPGAGEARRGVMNCDAVGESNDEGWCVRDGPVLVGEGSGIGALCLSLVWMKISKGEKNVLPDVEGTAGWASGES